MNNRPHTVRARATRYKSRTLSSALIARTSTPQPRENILHIHLLLRSRLLSCPYTRSCTRLRLGLLMLLMLLLEVIQHGGVLLQSLHCARRRTPRGIRIAALRGIIHG